MSKKRKLFTLVIFASLLLILSVLLTGCSGSRAENVKRDNSNSSGPQPIDVSVSQAISRDLPQFFEAQGSFAGDEQTDVSPAVAGKVVSVGVDLGSFVQKGQLLVQLDDRDARLRLEQAQAQVEQQQATVRQAEEKLGLKPGQPFDPEKVPEVGVARAGLDLASKQLARFDKLIESGDVSRSNYDQQKSQRDQLERQYAASVTQARQNYAAVQTARAGVVAAQTQVDQSRKAIADARVLAPFAGFVADRAADLGEYVTTTTKVATVVRTNPLRVRIDVPEQSVPSIRSGQTVSVTTSAFPDRTFNGHIARLSPNVTAASRTLTVEAEVDNSSNELKPGQFATIRILLPQTQAAVLVPQTAVRTEGNVSRVFVVKDGHAVQSLVQLGQTDGDLIEIKNGIAKGDSVATSNVDQLQDGSVVKQ